MKNEKNIINDKSAIASMRNAFSHMQATLRRIETLEMALGNAINCLQKAKLEISPRVFCIPIEGRTVHDRIDEEIRFLQKNLEQ